MKTPIAHYVPSETQVTLGIHVMPQRVTGVLLRRKGDALDVVQHMTEPYKRSEGASPAGWDTPSADRSVDEAVDVTLEIGGDAAGRPAASQHRERARGQREAGSALEDALDSMLAACRQNGYDTPDLAFCIGASDVRYTELTVPPGTPATRPSRWAQSVPAWLPGGDDAPPTTLHSHLRSAHPDAFDPDRVAFLPMSAAPAAERHLALVPRPAASPLYAWTGRSDATASPLVVDAEAAILTRFVQDHLSTDLDAYTAVVRAGAQDTLVLFFEGDQLHQIDSLQSLTAYDGAHTICSRVLLKQDEHQIDRIDRVLLAGALPPTEACRAFRTQYADGDVHWLSDVALGRTGIQGEGAFPREASALALLAALQCTAAVRDGEALHTTLLASNAPQRRAARRRLPVAWHTAVMLLVLLGTTMLFTWRYMERRHAVSQAEQAIARRAPSATALTPADLRHRVDSLNTLHRRYDRALHVLDSLLVGSDEWSRTLARTAKLTGSISGIWFERWSVRDEPARIEIRGLARSRRSLAQLARNLDGTVETLEFAEIDGTRVFPFTIHIPRVITLPRVATALREPSTAPEGALPAPATAPSSN